MTLYKELVENNIANRGTIVSTKEIKAIRFDKERYCSMFSFDETMVEHVKNKKSIADYIGPMAVETIWIDLDNEKGLDEVRRTTIELVKKLSVISELSVDNFPVFFSGGKGFHVAINATLLGISAVVEQKLNDKIKDFVEHISKGVKHVDLKIYNSTRIFRVPFSFNDKGKMYKIYLPYINLTTDSIDKIKEYAKTCVMFKFPKLVFKQNSGLTKAYVESSMKMQEKPKIAMSANEKTSLFAIPQNGTRNEALFKMAFRLFSSSNLNNNEAIDIMNAIFNQTMAVTGGGMSIKEFNTTLASAMKRSVKESDGLDISAVHNLSSEIFKQIKNSSYVPTFIKEYDADLGGGLHTGNMYPFIGKNGSKKSLLAMSMGIMNAVKSPFSVAYFNMEMSNMQAFKRIVRMIFNIDLAAEIESGKIKEEDIAELQLQLATKLNNRFFLIANNNLNVKDMSSAMHKISDESGSPVRLVIIDSMNSMSTVGGSEVMTAFEHTKQLKQLAKDEKCAVVLVNHVTKECPRHLRDTSLYVRGGEKILDNCDGYFCLSLCVDKKNSQIVGADKDYKYLADKVYVRFNNKRESGAVIDKIMHMNEDLMLFAEDINPKMYETYFSPHE